MKTRLYLIILCLAVLSQTVSAQSIWTSAEAKYKVTKNLGVSAEGEYRTNDGVSATGRWDVSIGADYKILKQLKFSTGYTFIRQRVEKEVTKKGNIIPAYWQPKHRFYADLTGSYDWNRFTFSLRERYQYTYRTEQSVPKFDSDGVTPKSDEEIAAKSKHVMRSRIGIEYSIRKSNFTPYVTCEFYNSLNDGFDLDKIRYTVGSDYKFDKHNSVTLYYRYIDKDDSDETAGHVIGVGYKFKF